MPAVNGFDIPPAPDMMGAGPRPTPARQRRAQAQAAAPASPQPQAPAAARNPPQPPAARTADATPPQVATPPRPAAPAPPRPTSVPQAPAPEPPRAVHVQPTASGTSRDPFVAAPPGPPRPAPARPVPVPPRPTVYQWRPSPRQNRSSYAGIALGLVMAGIGLSAVLHATAGSVRSHAHPSPPAIATVDTPKTVHPVPAATRTSAVPTRAVAQPLKRGPAPGRSHFYTARRGDTLARIAARHHLSIRQLMALGRNAARFRTRSPLRPGQRIAVP